DAAEPGIRISLIARCCHYSPLQNRVAVRVHIPERTWFLLHVLVLPSSLDERFQYAANDSHPSRAEMVPQLGDGEAIRGATGEVERLRRDVVPHHDARI